MLRQRRQRGECLFLWTAAELRWWQWFHEVLWMLWCHCICLTLVGLVWGLWQVLLVQSHGRPGWWSIPGDWLWERGCLGPYSCWTTHTFRETLILSVTCRDSWIPADIRYISPLGLVMFPDGTSSRPWNKRQEEQAHTRHKHHSYHWLKPGAG